MWLEALDADRLRNLRTVSVRLSAGLTVVTGRNGQGKTSLLEAAYLLATGRSFRTRSTSELVAWKGGPLRVAGGFSSRKGHSELKVLMDQSERRLIADGIEIELENFLGRLDMVDLTAERMKVLRGGPEERRRFLDRGVVGLRPSFLRSLGEYRRVLRQRNALLRLRGRPGLTAELDAWDERLGKAAEEVHRQRREYAVRLGGVIGETARALFSNGGEIRVHYRPSPVSLLEAQVPDLKRTFVDALARGRARDLEVGHTCCGPHRDEVSVELDGVDLRRFGSAGQVRGAMIALKLGKLSLLASERGEVPVFMMDDFDSDLDEVRAAALAEYLREGGFQVLVATSKEVMADRLNVPFTKILVSEGTVREA